MPGVAICPGFKASRGMLAWHHVLPGFPGTSHGEGSAPGLLSLARVGLVCRTTGCAALVRLRALMCCWASRSGGGKAFYTGPQHWGWMGTVFTVARLFDTHTCSVGHWQLSLRTLSLRHGVHARAGKRNYPCALPFPPSPYRVHLSGWTAPGEQRGQAALPIMPS